MAINDRISDLIYQLQMNPNSFADSLGVKGTVIYNIIKGRRSKPSYALLQKIMVTFDTVNGNWLLRGEGNIWKNEDDNRFDCGYESIDKQIKSLILSLKETIGDDPAIEELSELVHMLLKENVSQKERIKSLYQKHDRVLQLVRDRRILGLDI